MDFHWWSWISIDFHWLSWISMDFHCVDFYRFSLVVMVSMDFH